MKKNLQDFIILLPQFLHAQIIHQNVGVFVLFPTAALEPEEDVLSLAASAGEFAEYGPVGVYVTSYRSDRSVCSNA